MRAPRAVPAAVRLFGTTAFVLAGLLVWGLHLAIVYGVHHLACARGVDAPVVAAIVALATFAALGLQAALLAKPRWIASRLRPPPPDAPPGAFLEAVMRWLAVLGAAGVLWAGSAILFVAACGGG